MVEFTKEIYTELTDIQMVLDWANDYETACYDAANRLQAIIKHYLDAGGRRNGIERPGT